MPCSRLCGKHPPPSLSKNITVHLYLYLCWIYCMAWYFHSTGCKAHHFF
jgi:hypothetical protein